ncbi:hypothetical protein D3C77_483240 [compost metagenome]
MPSNSLTISPSVRVELFLSGICVSRPKKEKIVDIRCRPSTTSHLPLSSSATKIGGIGIPSRTDSIKRVCWKADHLNTRWYSGAMNNSSSSNMFINSPNDMSRRSVFNEFLFFAIIFSMFVMGSSLVWCWRLGIYLDFLDLSSAVFAQIVWLIV